MKTIGVLNLQGAVSEHLQMLQQFNVNAVAVKQPSQLAQLDGLIIPGGESTAISRLITENQLFEPIQQFAANGKGIFGTCAGLILCGSQLASPNAGQAVQQLKLLDITVERNGFGRQIASFEVDLMIAELAQPVPAVFIRAPYITQAGPEVKILAKVDDRIVMARQQNILVCAFHPELTQDTQVMRYFVEQCC